MVIHWPDMFYHCSLDTPDKMDPVELERVGKLTATYAYFIANAGTKEAQWLALMMCEKGKERILKKVREIITDMDGTSDEEKAVDPHEILDYILERECFALHSLKKLADIDTESLEKEFEHFTAIEKEKIPVIAEKEKGKEKEECTWVPTRIYRGPISTRKIFLEMPFEELKAYEKKKKEYKDARVIGIMGVYWADGKRTLSEIDRLIRMEIGRSSLECLKWYFEFLEKYNLITLKK
jgi:hypothetical protein